MVQRLRSGPAVVKHTSGMVVSLSGGSRKWLPTVDILSGNIPGPLRGGTNTGWCVVRFPGKRVVRAGLHDPVCYSCSNLWGRRGARLFIAAKMAIGHAA